MEITLTKGLLTVTKTGTATHAAAIKIFVISEKVLIFAVPIFRDLSLERCSSGLRGTPGKRVYSKRVSRVRISVSPQ